LKIRLIIAIFATAALSAHAEDGWIYVTSNDEIQTEFQSGSFVVQNNRGGKEIAVATVRTIIKKTSYADLGKTYVSTADCNNKQGKIIRVGVDNEYKYENDFIFNGGTMASIMAEFLCQAYYYQLKQISDKGL